MSDPSNITFFELNSCYSSNEFSLSLVIPPSLNNEFSDQVFDNNCEIKFQGAPQLNIRGSDQNEGDHPSTKMKAEVICSKKSRRARRKGSEIIKLKSSYHSENHDLHTTTSSDNNRGMRMTKRNTKMKLGFGGVNYIPAACDETTQTDDNKGKGLSVPLISTVGTSKNDVPTKPTVGMSHGYASVCGRRREMEDAVSIIPGLISSSSVNHRCRGMNGEDGVEETKYDFFAVYDGHGGSRVANVCRDQLHGILLGEIESRDQHVIDWENVMVSCFLKMDDEVSGEGVGSEDIKSIGSTAVVGLISTDQIIVANCGDSRAVLSRGGTAIPLSQDHRPDRTDEMERVEAAGGRVINWNGYRVLGVLATSRSIGDHYLKPYVISVPEVTITSRTESDEFVILASDGLWDVMSNDMACNIARKCLLGKIARKFASGPMLSSPSSSSHTSNAALAAAILAELAMAKGSKDNISVVVIELKKLSSCFA